MFDETAEHYSVDANMFFLLTKQKSCESYLCHAMSINELQPLGIEKIIKVCS